MAYRSHQRPAPKRNRQETIISISAPNLPTNGAASSLTFADLPEGLALKAQGFVKPGRLLIDGAWVEAVSGKTFETEGTSEEKARADYRKIAERRVRLGLVLSEIGELRSAAGMVKAKSPIPTASRK